MASFLYKLALTATQKGGGRWKCGSGKCRSGKYGSNNAWKAVRKLHNTISV